MSASLTILHEDCCNHYAQMLERTAQMSNDTTELLNRDDSEGLLKAGRSRIFDEAEALRLIGESLDERFVAAVRLIRMARGKVVTVGVGTSGPVARRLAHLLSTSGTPSLFLHRVTRSMADSARSPRRTWCWLSRRAADPPS